MTIAPVLLLLVLPWSGTTRAGPIEGTRVTPSPPSLSAYYPPEAGSRVYTHEMLELGRLMGTLAADLEKDSPAVRQSLAAFAVQLDRVAAMVPEWSARFPEPAFAELVKNADTAEGRHAIEQVLSDVSETCTECHMTDLFTVQAQYHWPAFSAVRPLDENGQPIPFHRTMVELSNHMAALPVAVEREQWEDAAEHQGQLARQFELLEKSCTLCHAEPRAYFVDERIRGIVMFAGGMVRVRNVDIEEYREKMHDIETQSCIPCHQLHMPAAYVQMQLSEED